MYPCMSPNQWWATSSGSLLLRALSAITRDKNERGGVKLPGLKTNERPGTRAVLRHYRMSASKARQVLDLIRGLDVDRAAEMLATTEREAAVVIGKVLASAVANAVNNDHQDIDTLYVSSCYADEGPTLKRWRPRAKGRATRIRKRTCHITIIVSRLSEERLEQRRLAMTSGHGAHRSRRVAESRRRADLSSRLSRRRAAHEAEAEAETDELTEVETDIEVSSVNEEASGESSTQSVAVDEVDDVAATAEQDNDEIVTDEITTDEIAVGGESADLEPAVSPDEEKGE